jgi:ribonuclease P/MRP protein subunit RPP1
MAAPLLFYDLSLLPSVGDDSSSPSSRLQLLAATARALELGYAAAALDHPHRGLLADSHRCRTDLFPPLSSLPLPPSAALHRRRLASPASEPFRQYTRITLSLDSAAAAASALAPSAARLLRTYDLVAARPLTQAAFDHLCQAPLSAHHLDLISIDFSSHSKLPFRIKLPMLKLALHKGLHFEIAYSPLISTDINAKRNLLAEVKVNLLTYSAASSIPCSLFFFFAKHFCNHIQHLHIVYN